jgi:hypothetical protein
MITASVAAISILLACTGVLWLWWLACGAELRRG